MLAPHSIIAAAVQLRSGSDLAANLDRAAEWTRRAAARGASLIVLPENFALMTGDDAPRRAAAETLAIGSRGVGPIVARLSEVARKARSWLVLGGMPERIDGDATRAHNACVLLGPDGAIHAIYRKMHLFDVHIPDGARYEESRHVAPGEQTVLAELPFGGLGLSVCYDLRFPELYRALAAAGARVLVVPAAFTLHTGRDHWQVLLRARAIENLCYVVAAAQCGRHEDGRVTYGHSAIVDPWGTVLAEAPDGEGVVLAELDFARQDRLRAELPALRHRRL